MVTIGGLPLRNLAFRPGQFNLRVDAIMAGSEEGLLWFESKSLFAVFLHFLSQIDHLLQDGNSLSLRLTQF